MTRMHIFQIAFRDHWRDQICFLCIVIQPILSHNYSIEFSNNYEEGRSLQVIVGFRFKSHKGEVVDKFPVSSEVLAINSLFFP
jgi:hypothetical protein